MISKFTPLPGLHQPKKEPRFKRVKTNHLCLTLLCFTYIFKVKITFFFDNPQNFLLYMNHVTHPTEAYLEPCQTSQMNLSEKKANSLIIFAK